MADERPALLMSLWLHVGSAVTSEKVDEIGNRALWFSDKAPLNAGIESFDELPYVLNVFDRPRRRLRRSARLLPWTRTFHGPPFPLYPQGASTHEDFHWRRLLNPLVPVGIAFTLPPTERGPNQNTETQAVFWSKDTLRVLRCATEGEHRNTRRVHP